MFGKKEKVENNPKNEVEQFLVNGEVIEHIYPLILDFLCITNKRLIFVDKDLNLSKPKTKTQIHSIPFSKIESVSLEKNDKLFAFTNTIEIATKAETHELKFTSTNIVEIFNNIAAKTL